MRAIRFAWLSLVRQPARSLLGILGVAAIGALLFNMLLLSRGLILSFSHLLERSGFDVRVLATDAPPFTGPHITRATPLVTSLAAIPGIEAVLPVRLRRAEIVADEPREYRRRLSFIGVDPRVKSMWTLVEGNDLPERTGPTPAVVVNSGFAVRQGLHVGSSVLLRARCGDDSDSVPPVRFIVTGIADFPFDSADENTAAGTLADVDRLCGEENTEIADMLLVRSTRDVGAPGAAIAIRESHPELYVVTNAELVERFSRVEFSYFRQISTVLATITLFFGFLLVATLLTVSVNQRLAEIAALRAVGLSRSRVIAGVLSESMMLVGAGGLLALPLAGGLSVWLDTILRTLPGLPADIQFFVLYPGAVGRYVALLTVASLAAAVYPVRIVSVLPIAATLRREAIS